MIKIETHKHFKERKLKREELKDNNTVAPRLGFGAIENLKKT